MKITLINKKERPEEIFGLQHMSTGSKGILHQVIVAYQNGARQGTKAQLNRGSMTRTNKKPWKQKGTGRARAGDSKSPIWIGGGVTFAQRQVRDYSQKINKKVFQKSLKIALSRLVDNNKLYSIPDTDCEMEKPSTRTFLDGFIQAVSKTDFKDQVVNGHTKCLFILPDSGSDNTSFVKSVMNIPHINTITQNSMNPYTLLLSTDKVFITETALKQLELRFGVNASGEES